MKIQRQCFGCGQTKLTGVIKCGVILVPTIKTAVQDSISLIERSFNAGADRTEPVLDEGAKDWAFRYEPARSVFLNQARMVRLTAIERKMPLVWLTQTNSALDTLTNLLCFLAKIDVERIAEGCMQEDDFPPLMSACGVVAGSRLRMCDVDATNQFEDMVWNLGKENETTYLLCDWDLSCQEEALAESLVQNRNMSVCWPQ